METKLFKLAAIGIFVFSFLMLGLTLQPVLADTPFGQIESPTGDTTLFDFINRFSRFLRPVIALLFLMMIIYGGYTRMTAAGDPEKEKKSVAIITAAIVGFVIIVLAPVIVELITSLLGIENAIFA